MDRRMCEDNILLSRDSKINEFVEENVRILGILNRLPDLSFILVSTTLMLSLGRLGRITP